MGDINTGPSIGPFQLWIGNIPFDASDEELLQSLSVVAKVQSVRIKYDPETGQSKGYAFCECADAETCTVLLKNANLLHLRGRKLKLDTVTSENREQYERRNRIQKTSSESATKTTESMPRGQIDFASRFSMPTTPYTDPFLVTPGALNIAVSEFVSTLSQEQLLFILYHFQHFSRANPFALRRILSENPSLIYTLLHAMYILNIYNPRNQYAHQKSAYNISFDALSELPESHQQRLDNVKLMKSLKRNVQKSKTIVKDLKGADIPKASSIQRLKEPTLQGKAPIKNIPKTKATTSKPPGIKTAKASQIPPTNLSVKKKKPKAEMMPDQQNIPQSIDKSFSGPTVPAKRLNYAASNTHPAWAVQPAPNALVEEVLKNDDMLSNILNSKVVDMQTWLPEQRQQVLSLQSALLRRGYKILE